MVLSQANKNNDVFFARYLAVVTHNIQNSHSHPADNLQLTAKAFMLLATFLS
jgi:hypothetical protein